MLRPKSLIRKSYFIISVFGYFVDVFGKLSEAIADQSYLTQCLTWHWFFFIGIWQFTLVLNRFTSVVFWQKYDIIWADKMAYFWCFGIYIYPIIVDITFIILEPLQWECVTKLFSDHCQPFFADLLIRQTVSNSITCAGSIVLSTITVIQIRKTSASKVATRLIVQTCIMTVVFAIFTVAVVLFSFAWKARNRQQGLLFGIIGNISLYTHQCIGCIWLVIICHGMMKSQTTVAKRDNTIATNQNHTKY
uniref:Serpentine receptor class gamma n=1 Tax=Panagrellus redivivus TaxID=6233 RepID=A0A7E4UXQ9_PANRE